MLRIRSGRVDGESLEDFYAYTKQSEFNDQYVETSMRQLMLDITLGVQEIIKNANYSNTTMNFLYKDSVTNEVLSYTPHFQKVIAQLFGPGGINNIMYNPSCFVQNRRLLTSRPVWSSAHLRFGHRGCLITKRHVIYQHHSVVPQVGQSILFLDENNQKVMRTVINSYNLGLSDNGNILSPIINPEQSSVVRDFGLVRLDSDVPDSIQPAIFCGYPFLDFLKIATSHRYSKINGMAIKNNHFDPNKPNLFYLPFLRHYRTRDIGIVPAGVEIDNDGSTNPLICYKKGTPIPDGSPQEDIHDDNFYNAPPMKIWGRNVRFGDSGHATGFIYKNMYIATGNETIINYLQEFHLGGVGSVPGTAERVSLEQKIQEWEGVNAHNYEVKMLTKYSV